MGKPILMGRKTFESIGRALPGRRNIVITRDSAFSADGCEVANSVDDALSLCHDESEIMLIGGASLYQQTIERADCMYITRIHHRFDGDTWFPEFETSDWKVESIENFAADENNRFAHSFVKYVRDI